MHFPSPYHECQARAEQLILEAQKRGRVDVNTLRNVLFMICQMRTKLLPDFNEVEILSRALMKLSIVEWNYLVSNLVGSFTEDAQHFADRCRQIRKEIMETLRTEQCTVEHVRNSEFTDNINYLNRYCHECPVTPFLLQALFMSIAPLPDELFQLTLVRE